MIEVVEKSIYSGGDRVLQTYAFAIYIAIYRSLFVLIFPLHDFFLLSLSSLPFPCLACLISSFHSQRFAASASLHVSISFTIVFTFPTGLKHTRTGSGFCVCDLSPSSSLLFVLSLTRALGLVFCDAIPGDSHFGTLIRSLSFQVQAVFCIVRSRVWFGFQVLPFRVWLGVVGPMVLLCFALLVPCFAAYTFSWRILPLTSLLSLSVQRLRSFSLTLDSLRFYGVLPFTRLLSSSCRSTPRVHIPMHMLR